MHYFQLIVIALILAVDATVYAFSYGLVLRQQRARAAFWLALTVGVFQAGMPLLGYWGGDAMRSVVDYWAPWIVMVVFGALGGNIIFQAWRGEDEEDAPLTPLGLVGLTLVGIATSIDALAVGACMALGDIGGAQHHLGLAVTIIGAVTFFCALLAFHSARFLLRLPIRWLETIAGLLLVALGLQGVV